MLRANVATLGAADCTRVIRSDAMRFVERLDGDGYDVAFADPPYRRGLAALVAERWREAPFAAVLGVEHALADPLPAGAADTRRYGSTAVTFYRA